MVGVCCLMCLAVTLLDSSFLATCHTFAAGYCARSALPSFIVLAINSLSVMKTQKMSLVRIAAVSGGYLHNGMCTCTALYHLSMLLLPCQNVFNKSNYFNSLGNQCHIYYLLCALQYTTTHLWVPSLYNT